MFDPHALSMIATKYAHETGEICRLDKDHNNEPFAMVIWQGNVIRASCSECGKEWVETSKKTAMKWNEISNKIDSLYST